MRAVLTAIVIAVLAAGCGYKGPLYLPKPKPAAQQPASPAPEKKNEEDARP